MPSVPGAFRHDPTCEEFLRHDTGGFINDNDDGSNDDKRDALTPDGKEFNSVTHLLFFFANHIKRASHHTASEVKSSTLDTERNPNFELLFSWTSGIPCAPKSSSCRPVVDLCYDKQKI